MKKIKQLDMYLNSRLVVMNQIKNVFKQLEENCKSHSLEIIYTDLQNTFCKLDNFATKNNSDVQLAIKVVDVMMSIGLYTKTVILISIAHEMVLYTSRQIHYMGNLKNIVQEIIKEVKNNEDEE